MKIKKNLTLISLMLGVIMLVGIMGIVSAEVIPTSPSPVCGNGILEAGEACDDGNTVNTDACSNTCQVNPCELIVDQPIAGYFYDPVKIGWHLEGYCPSVQNYVPQFKAGDCNPNGAWSTIDTKPFDSNMVGNPPSIDWYSLPQSGQYCIRVIMNGAGCLPNGCCTVTGYSGTWNLDLVPPVVSLSIGDPKVGECAEGQTGNCYVNKNTKLTLTCSDNNPSANWQSGPDSIQYRYSVDGGSFTSWTTYKGPFAFPQDSNHTLEYKCDDKVGKESDTKTKTIIVDTQAPTLDRTVGTPQKTLDNQLYVNTNTQICVTAVDPQPHPSDNVQLTCEYYWGDNPQGAYPGEGSYTVNLGAGGTGCFTYKQDSYHTLTCTATDALGNSVQKVWYDIVDTQAPKTDIGYFPPLYSDRNSVWLGIASTVQLTAQDPNPHPVGVDKTYYRYEKVDDSYCRGEHQDIPALKSGWTTYTVPFSIKEESCHAIEYYSVDALGNTESFKTEFVFVDDTAPSVDLSVGQSGKNCNNPLVNCEEGWDYKVTMDTPITISCEDQGPHPSGVQKICYTILWDGSTSKPHEVCTNADSVTFQFTEPCEHKVIYTCTDNVGKTSNDSKTIKVIGQDFNIPLDKKWNLISVPVNLLSTNVKEVFSGISSNIVEVWSYEGGEWKVYYPGDENDSTLTTIIPGRGYWVKTNNPTNLLIGGSLFEEATLPNSVPLDEGWNLIGHYGVASRDTYCSLLSLVDTTIGFPKWSAVVGYNSATKTFEGLTSTDTMEAGKGYWVAMNSADNYNYATDCVNYTAVI
jgi:cysteine-rich repeat protein